MSSPLAGRRVVVTRSSEQASALVQALEARGATAVVLPLIKVVEPADGGAALARALDQLELYDWIVVTSPNGARRVRDRLATALPGRPLVAAVGAATAAELGRAADLVPRRQLAEGLLEELPPGHGRVLLVQADRARPVLAEGLRARGWSVEEVVAYCTVPVEVASVPAEVRVADAVTFTSGSTAQAWVRVLGSWTPPIVVAIGPATAQVALDAGLKVTHVATHHSLDGLIAALESALAPNR